MSQPTKPDTGSAKGLISYLNPQVGYCIAVGTPNASLDDNTKTPKALFAAL